MEDLVYWIWLSLACTPDTATFPRLIEEFGDAKTIYDSDIKRIMSVLNPSSSDRAALADKDLGRAKEILDFSRKYNVGMLSYCDSKYPESLRNIPTPPVLLYYRGVLPDFSKAFPISVVGTRSLSVYGRRNAFKISYDLAAAGALIVSGMAVGIDSVAHAAALAAEAPTVAVLGSGINVCYPESHLTLAREIVKSGCIITEFPPNTQPSRFNFPRRNRIISGLSKAVLVIEGGERSGAMITARCAQKQERAVYALPGNVESKNSGASNILLQNGAKLCVRAENIINDFQSEAGATLNPFKLSDRPKVDMQSALSKYKVVAECDGDPVFIRSKGEKRVAPALGVASGVGLRGDGRYAQKNTVSSEIESEPQKCGFTKLSVESSQSVDGIDKECLRIYKKIPLTGTCDVDSLEEDGIPAYKLMKQLVKLETVGMITLLPGNLVERKRRK